MASATSAAFDRWFLSGPCWLALACADHTAGAAPFAGASSPAPAPQDRGALCLDVGAARACWAGPAAPTRCGTPVCLTPRELPRAVAPSAGWRCAGQASGRRCESRAQQAGPFVCADARCVQRTFRRPDRGEWDCVELTSVLVCQELTPAAGIASGARDPAFVCGTRRGHGARICVDYAPDAPPLDSFQCAIRHDTGIAERVCQRATSPRIGGPCASRPDCPDAAACVSGVCLPARPAPDCWFDTDCGQAARCRLGTCVGDG